jgi:hypothetical protein
MNRNTNWKFIKYILLCLQLLNLISCVGEIESGQQKLNKSAQLPPNVDFYDGLFEVKAIANDKVEVYFYPSDTESISTVYEISYQGLESPISIPSEILVADYRGLYMYRLQDLTQDTDYEFSVQVRDTETGEQSYNLTTKTVTTFDNDTADFNGITKVEALPGIAGMNGIKVIWPQARKEGSLVSPQELDPTNYVVTVINGDRYTPADFDNESIPNTFRKVVNVNPDQISVQINGLAAETKYYIRVRAVHYGYTQFGSDSDYKVETNNSYLSHTTLSSDTTNIEFDQESFAVSIPDTAAGLTSANLTWSSASGVFDHYRIYYTNDTNTNLESFSTPDGTCNGQESTNSKIYCSKMRFEDISGTVSSLSPHSTYSFAIAVCTSLSCEASNRVMSSTISAKTTPPEAYFEGIRNISDPIYSDKTDSIYLEMVAPDLDTGIADGLLILYIDEVGNEYYLNHPDDPNNSSLDYTPFDFSTANTIEISNIDDLSESTEYCFKLLPFLYDNDGEVIPTPRTYLPKCISPKISAPTLEEFSGAESCYAIGANYLGIDWTMPDAGIYSHFEVIIREGSAGFSFADAIAGDPSYTTIFIDDSNNNYAITPLASGTSYQLGVLSYFEKEGTQYRSEFNNVLTCTTL